MQRRIIAAVAAVLLAGIGAAMLYSYVNTAEARALAKMETTTVLVATKVIPAGTLGADLAPFVALKQLPKIAVVDGTLTDVVNVGDLVTTSDFQIGEQLLAARFGEPNMTTAGEVDVPSDLQQLTVQLGPDRVIGTNIAPGNKVGVMISKEENQVGLTKLAFRDVLVTRVQGAPGAPAEAGDVAPSSDLLVTLAISPQSAAQIVWGAEFGHLYLVLEPVDGDHDSLPLVKAKTVLG